MKIVLTGGGTGGHIMPVIAVAKEIKKTYQGNDLKLYYFGPQDATTHEMLSKENIKTYKVIAGKIRRYFSLENILDIFYRFPVGFLQSFFLLLFIRPKLVFSKGGTGSLPLTFASRLLWIPVMLHESDIEPGLSNKITAKWAKKIFTSFENTTYFKPEKIMLVGNPLKKELLEGDGEKAKDIFQLQGQKPVLLFMGGSQGSETINDLVLAMLNNALWNYEIIHITGPKNYQRVNLVSKTLLAKELEPYYHPHGFLDEEQLKHAYAAADFIVSRAGSGGIFELSALGKPAILIPLPTAANDHQSKNAYAYAATGAALVLEQGNLTPGFFLGEIDLLFSQPERLEAMKKAALQFAKPMAAEFVAREIIQF